MAKGRGGTGIVLEFGRGSGDEDDWDEGEGDDLEALDEPARSRPDAQALIDEAERTLSELRALLAETG